MDKRKKASNKVFSRIFKLPVRMALAVRTAFRLDFPVVPDDVRTADSMVSVHPAYLVTMAALLVLVPHTNVFADLLLAKAGKAMVRITFAPRDNLGLEEAGQILAKYLRRMTGATFSAEPGESEDGTIHLAKARGAHVDAEIARRLESMGPEAYIIKVTDKKALLAGTSEKGVMDAAYDFLERLGCRWLIPSDRWIVIPGRAALKAREMVLYAQPDFAYRSI